MRGTLWTALIASLMLLMLYRRLKFVGKHHRIRPLRMLLRVGLWLLLGTALFFVPRVSAPYAVGAAVLGFAIALYALQQTQFAVRDKKLTYRSSKWIGVTLFVLLAARVTWRLFDRFVNGRPFFRRRLADPELAGANGSEHVPVMLTLVFLLIAYRVSYSIGILLIATHKKRRRRRRLDASLENAPNPAPSARGQLPD